MMEKERKSEEQRLRIRIIRHGATPGNQLGRYIGITDEELSEEGKKSLSRITSFVPQKLYVSPMKRCIQTAEILFPDMEMQISQGLKECNFGEFENKNYKELAGNSHYQDWVDSFCEGPIPGGECKSDFQARTTDTFSQIIDHCIQENLTDIAIVAHGGTIMAVLDAWSKENKSYYDWHVKNGGGYLITLNKAVWMSGEKWLSVLGSF